MKEGIEIPALLSTFQDGMQTYQSRRIGMVDAGGFEPPVVKPFLPSELSALVSRAEVLPFLSLHLEIASLESDQINSSISVRSNTYTGD